MRPVPTASLLLALLAAAPAARGQPAPPVPPQAPASRAGVLTLPPAGRGAAAAPPTAPQPPAAARPAAPALPARGVPPTAPPPRPPTAAPIARPPAAAPAPAARSTAPARPGAGPSGPSAAAPPRGARGEAARARARRAAAAAAAATGTAAVAPAPAPAAPAAPAEPPPPPVGTVTGLPLPRFVSIRPDTVNLRAGPGVRYPIEWTFQRPNLPVEIVREVDQWRRIRDREGTEGWVRAASLAGRRTFVVAGAERVLRRRPEEAAAPVARLGAGVIGRLRACDADSPWCQAEAGGVQGWVRRTEIWGVGPDEVVRD